jgi:general secretion pathway protein D
MRLRFALLPLSLLVARAMFAQAAPPAAPAAPATTPAAPSQAAPAPSTQAADGGRTLEPGLFQLDNASLTDLVNVLAKRLKINIIVDPRVNGAVTIHTYGDVKQVDLMPLLQTVLRVNHATLVQVGDLYHVVPVNSISQLPINPLVNADGKTLPDDERMILDLIFLKYATATEIEKLIKPFLGEGASDAVYEPANLIIVQDNSRNMKRTLDLLAMFDSDTFSGQRVRLFEVENSRPSDLVKDLDTVFKAYALSDKGGAVKFIPIDRINTLIAVAPNPGIFEEVQKWIAKLDIAPKIPVGASGIWVYRLKYGRAETMAMAIMALYSGNPMALIQMAREMNQSRMMQGMGYQGGGYGGGGYGGGGYGGGAYGGGGYGAGGYGGGYGAGGYGGAGYGGGYGAAGYGGNAAYQNYPAGTTPFGSSSTPLAGNDQTGQYLKQGTGQGSTNPNAPHVIPNPFDNTLLVQGSSQEWEQIKHVLDQLDVAPRQVLIDAKIYEVDLNDTYNLGLTSALNNPIQTGNLLNGTNSGSGSGLTLTAGWLVSRTRLLQAQLTAAESRGTTKLVSAPSVIATDSIPATMNIGSQIPVATSTSASTITSGGTSVPIENISSQSSGITLSIVARVNSSGVVTLEIGQQVSSPENTTTSNIDSPSFTNRSVSTQVTVQDGDTIAVGGGITESYQVTTGGIPYLNRLPGIGFLFGNKSVTKNRSELIIFFTPRVIYDTNAVVDAGEEIRKNLKHIGKISEN